MIIDTFDQGPGARSGAKGVAHELEIDFVGRARVPRRVHQLDREIDAFGRRVGALRGQDVLLAEDRRAALDQQPGPLVGVGDDAVAEDDALARLELDLQGHGFLRTGRRRRNRFRSLLTDRKNANGGAEAPPFCAAASSTVQPPKSFRTLFEACAASASEVVDSDCLVCSASMLAPSSLESASTRLSAPVLSVLIIAFMKSCRNCTTERFEPSADAWLCKVLIALFSWVSELLTS